MLKRIAIAAVLGAVVAGCARGGGSMWEATKDHTQWHVLKAYKDLVEIHKEIDLYFFNLDERDPNCY